jgi:multisubunit Na+/H+ antiporter MnhE subunit
MPGPASPVVSALVSSFFLESICYGMYLVSCGFSVKALFTIGYPARWRRVSEFSWIILSAWIILFVNSAFNVSLAILRQKDAFVAAIEGKQVELGSDNNWSTLAKVLSCNKTLSRSKVILPTHR